MRSPERCANKRTMISRKEEKKRGCGANYVVVNSSTIKLRLLGGKLVRIPVRCNENNKSLKDGNATSTKD